MKALKLIADFSMFRIFVFAAFFTGAYYYMYYDNGATFETQIEQLNSVVSAEEIKKKDTEKTIKREDEMRANLAALARDLQVVKAKLPNEFKDTEMTTIINKAATGSNVNVTSLARRQNAPAVSSNVVGAESVEEIVFDLALNARFNQFVQFLETLAREEKIIKIRDFVIEKNSRNVEDFIIKFKGDIVGFKQPQGPK